MKTGTRKMALLSGAAFLALAIITLAPQAGEMEPWGPPAPTWKPLGELEPRRVIHSELVPLLITDSGSSWYLTGSIAFEGPENGIVIEADDVTIDLNGFTLAGPGFGAGNGIHVTEGRTGITILNGTIRSWGNRGVDAELASHSRMHGLTLQGNGDHGVHAGSSAIVTECVAAQNSDFGIVADDLSVVRDCLAVSNKYGFSVDFGTISNCVAKDNTLIGITLGHGNTVVHCSAVSNGLHGIRFGAGNSIVDCVAKENAGNGFDAYSGNHISKNIAVDNGLGEGDGAGIYVYGRGNRVEANNVMANDRGIDVDEFGNLIIKNSANGNVTNYDIVAGNDVGPIGSAATSTSPWANISY